MERKKGEENKMGAFHIFHIIFKNKIYRNQFEKEEKIRKKDILVDENVNSYGFVAWTMNWKFPIEVIYYMGFMGYYDVDETYKKWKSKIKKFHSIAINDNSKWRILK